MFNHVVYTCVIYVLLLAMHDIISRYIIISTITQNVIAQCIKNIKSLF